MWDSFGYSTEGSDSTGTYLRTELDPAAESYAPIVWWESLYTPAV